MEDDRGQGSLCKPPLEIQQRRQQAQSCLGGAWQATYLGRYWAAVCFIRRRMRSCPFPSVRPTAEDDDHDPAFPCIASHCTGLLWSCLAHNVLVGLALLLHQPRPVPS